jgi:hypothetical protein
MATDLAGNIFFADSGNLFNTVTAQLSVERSIVTLGSWALSKSLPKTDVGLPCPSWRTSHGRAVAGVGVGQLRTEASKVP